MGWLFTSERTFAGEVDMELSADVHCEDAALVGSVYVTNNGKTLFAPSIGQHPLRVGISIVDDEKNIVALDYVCLDIVANGFFKANETREIPIRLDDIDDFARQEYSLRFALIQEGISCFDDTAIYFSLQESSAAEKIGKHTVA